MVGLDHYIQQARGHYLHAEANARTFDEFLALYISQQPQRQTDFVFDAYGNPLVRFVGRFERLEEDTRQICEALDLPVPNLQKKNTSARSKKVDDYFKNQETKDLFLSYFRPDFIHFNYPM